jgi:hypothetical protein
MIGITEEKHPLFIPTSTPVYHVGSSWTGIRVPVPRERAVHEQSILNGHLTRKKKKKPPEILLGRLSLY